ncbi:MAG: hypothetical protein BroJett003_19810 [Planctomycetota bacterium]|nr:MAG: hypothetical protein BroJett003_19810 [Planctomycetota bacterium]
MLRWNEIRTLRWGDVDLNGDRPCIRVRAEVSKNRKAAEIRKLPPIPKTEAAPLKATGTHGKAIDGTRAGWGNPLTNPALARACVRDGQKGDTGGHLRPVMRHNGRHGVNEAFTGMMVESATSMTPSENPGKQAFFAGKTTGRCRT